MKFLGILPVVILSISFSVVAQQPDWEKLSKEAAKTEVYSPVPKVVTPGSTATQPPSDAVVLFDGTNLDAWHGEASSQPAGWKVENGIVTVDKSKGGIVTKQEFQDYQLHLEWKIPSNITGESQSRGNSGIFLAFLGTKDKYFEQGYELQILDNYNNSTYVNGQNGAVYKQTSPLVNVCRPPGEWQTYDVIWKAPRFKEDGSLETPAYLTVLQNGVLIQNHTELKGQTFWIGEPVYTEHGKAPIKLQAHGDPSEPDSFRNIWVRPL